MLVGSRCRVRAYAPEDVTSLPSVAGDPSVARWMTARFPHPYTLEDAKAWVDNVSSEDPANHFAIEVDGRLAGGIGLEPLNGEWQGGAAFGYWLAPEHRGRGIATEAGRLLVSHAFRERHFRRLEAYVFAPNVASARVLEKLGFHREAVVREALVDRDGAVTDAWLYAQLRSKTLVS